MAAAAGRTPHPCPCWALGHQTPHTRKASPLGPAQCPAQTSDRDKGPCKEAVLNLQDLVCPKNPGCLWAVAMATTAAVPDGASLTTYPVLSQCLPRTTSGPGVRGSLWPPRQRSPSGAGTKACMHGSCTAEESGAQSRRPGEQMPSSTLDLHPAYTFLQRHCGPGPDLGYYRLQGMCRRPVPPRQVNLATVSETWMSQPLASHIHQNLQRTGPSC